MACTVADGRVSDHHPPVGERAQPLSDASDASGSVEASRDGDWDRFVAEARVG
jgi:hypothetical protein